MSDEFTAQAFWVLRPGQGELRMERMLPLPAGQVRVRTGYSGVSRGTESLVFQGRVPASQYHTMRAPFQQGEFPGPVKYGYCSVGEVIAGPQRLCGRQVFCLYPHQDVYQVPLAAVTLLPPGLPPQRAVLAANMETAVNGVWDLAPRIGERIAVIGAGVVGLLAAWLCQGVIGCKVQLIDIDPAKAPIARRLGLSFATPERMGREFDKLIHASADPAGLALAMARAAFEATILELSWYGDRAAPLPLGEHFHSHRLTLRSSQVGTITPTMQRRWSHKRRLQLALRLLTAPELDALISGESDFSELPTVMAELAESAGALCHRIRY